MENGFPKRLRELRKQKNLSQSELAKRVGVHYTHIGRYERGVSSKPSADTLKRIANALDVTSDYLIEGSTEEVARVRIEDRELLQQFKQVEKLADDDKIVIKKLIEAFLTKKKVQELAAR